MTLKSHKLEATNRRGDFKTTTSKKSFMPLHEYPLERTIASCSQLMREIMNVRDELQSNSEKLREMVQEHSVLEASRKRLAELQTHQRMLAKRSSALAAVSAREEARIATLEAQFQSLQKQTEMTEMYVHHLDHEIEEALRLEESEERSRVQMDLIRRRRCQRNKDPSHAGEGTSTDELEGDEIEPWTREEEVDFLQLESLQQELMGDVKQYSMRIDDQKSELRAMLETLDEGERAVAEKRIACAKLEEEAELWRAQLDRVLQHAAARADNGSTTNHIT